MTIAGRRAVRGLAACGLAVMLAGLAGTTVAARQDDGVLKGLAVVGVVVEEPGSQAVTCGISQSTLEQAVVKIAQDGGLKVVRNTDEDTYLYVNVNSANISGGLCVTRYDVTLNTHTTVKLAYGQRPVLVEVSLLTAGGLSTSPVAGHADNVLKSVRKYADEFVGRIRAANGSK
jgi:hypothetical protein